MGSKEIPPPVRALDVLTRLLDPWRKLARDPEIAKTLFVQPAGIHGMPGKSGIGITFEDMILRRTETVRLSLCRSEQTPG